MITNQTWNLSQILSFLDIYYFLDKYILFLDKYLQTNGVYMRASGITLVSGPLVTVTPQYTPIAPTTAKDGRGSFIQNTKGRTNTKGRLNCIYTFFLAKTIFLVLEHGA